MGGHGHGHKPAYVVPDYRIYKVEDAPKLLKVQQDLAKIGLKDPWLRNDVWRYSPKFGTLKQVLYVSFFRGIHWGFGAFLLTIGIEKYFGITYGHGDHHGDEHSKHHEEDH